MVRVDYERDIEWLKEAGWKVDRSSRENAIYIAKCFNNEVKVNLRVPFVFKGEFMELLPYRLGATFNQKTKYSYGFNPSSLHSLLLGLGEIIQKKLLKRGIGQKVN